MKEIRRLTKSEIENAVQQSYSLRETAINLGYSQNSGRSATAIGKKIEEFNIDTSHFYPVYSNKKIDLSQILVENSNYARDKLKRRLILEGLLTYECCECGNKGEWNGKPLSLHLDHINGINNDNRLENLRFLCPNCHSQTNTYSGKNKNKD